MQAIEHVIAAAQGDREPTIILLAAACASPGQHRLDHVDHAQDLARGIGQGHRRGDQRGRVEVARHSWIAGLRAVRQQPFEQPRQRRQGRDEQGGQHDIEQKMLPLRGRGRPRIWRTPAPAATSSVEERHGERAAEKPVGEIANRKAQPARCRSPDAARRSVG